MKNKKLLFKISIIIASILILSIIILSLLGLKERVGYLSEFSLNIDNTLQLNGLDINKTKQLFTIDNKLDETSISNFIFTNISITNYSYNFRIKYYSKVFRNSDIYGVYPNLNNLPEYIQSAKMNDNNGTPFGNLVSIKKINTDKIDNIIYTLNIKNNIIVFAFLIIIFFFLAYVIIIYYKNILNFILEKKYLLNPKSIIKLIGFILIFAFMFIFISTIHPKYIPFNVVVISDAVGQGNINYIKWKTKYGFNDLQKYNFANAMVQTIKYNNDKISIKIDDSDINLNKYNYKNYYIIDDIVKDKKIEIFCDDKILFSNISDNNMSIIVDKKKQLINLSYALYNANNINIYTKGWKISTDDFFRRYSLIMYSKYDKSIQPLLINGNGIGDIIFDNFDNIFYQNIKKGTWEEYRIFSLIVATLIYTILIFLLIKVIVNAYFRTFIIKNSYIILYITYFFLLWGIFLLIGNYSPALKYDIFLKTNNSWLFYSYVIPQITHYLAGYRGYILPIIVTYSFISIIIYYILLNLKINKFLSFVFPITLMMLPNINYGLYAAMWPAIISGYLFVLSSLLIFLLIYGKDNHKKYYMLLSIIFSIIALLYRMDFVPILFMTLFSSILYIFYRYFNFNRMTLVISIVLSIIICLFFLKVSSFTARGSTIGGQGFYALYSQYLYAYLSTKFYKEDMFTEEEKIQLKFNEPYKYVYYANNIKVTNRLEGIQKYYKFEDFHPINANIYDVDQKILKKILIKKIFQNPYPVIYARIQSFKYYILPYFYPRGFENILMFYYKYSNFMDYNMERKISKKVYNDLLDKIVSQYNEKINNLFYRFFGFINIIIIIFLLLNFKKAPITAYINISSLLYYFILFLVSIVPVYYHYGPYLLGILSIILYVYESKYVKHKFDISSLNKLIKKGE